MKRRRISDTFTMATIVHGGNDLKVEPAINGLLQTVFARINSEKLAKKLLNTKPAVTKVLKSLILKEHCQNYYNSEQNVLRSLNIYYCSNILGKNKYSSLRRANKQEHVPNLIPYKDIARRISQVPIGNLHPIEGNLDYGLSEDEKGSGCYRDLRDHLPRLAEFYLNVDSDRQYKLLNFNSSVLLNNNVNKNSSVLLDNNSPTNPLDFHFTLGGDEAPSAGTSFLVSFVKEGFAVARTTSSSLLVM